ncbi:MAG: glycosyltransferase family 39 protein [Caldilineaceae bacterium]|nr:glycosyltransferase family 39 protein [Caldilineaceae bacterium]
MTGPMHRGIDATAYVLASILIVYAALGILFAVKTPPWQSPDEPAHYNYIAHIATERRLPVLRMGDYNEAYLEHLKAEKFPPDLSIEAVRYESHQPPLYYLIAVPVYWLSQGRPLGLRLFSVVLGGGVVLLIFLCARAAVPGSPPIALGVAAFAAFLPMHVALMASVNNDALAELLIAGTVVALLRWQRLEAGSGVDRGGRHLLAAGILIGLGFLTKATVYTLLPVALVVVFAQSVWPGSAGRTPAGELALRLALVVGPALLLGLPWWIRNSLLYGNLDILGLSWHDAVVTGQPTAAAWIAENGWGAYWERAWTFTSKSFWGVFGWLGVFMDARVYTFLFILTALAAVGIFFRFRAGATSNEWQWARFLSSPGMTLLLLWLATLAAYGWYNLGFIQHQGRYLFPALSAWSLLFAMGWWAVLERRASLAAGGVLLAVAGAHFVVATVAGGAADRWTLLLFGMAGIGMLFYGLLCGRISQILGAIGVGDQEGASLDPPDRLRNGGELRPILYVGLFLAVVALDIAIPFLYIVPQLGS